MGYKNRYLFIKKTYPNTIVIFEKNNTHISYDEDKYLLNYINVKSIKKLQKLNINYIIVKNMEIVEHNIFINNMYRVYYMRFKLNNIIDFILNKYQ